MVEFPGPMESPEKNPQRVNSLVYKDYTLVEHEDGTKLYVSPEEKSRIALEEKLKSSKVSTESEKPNHKAPAKHSDSDSDSGYEVPVDKGKPKSWEDFDMIPKPDMKRHSSLPFAGEDWSPGDNGKMNLPPHIIPLETSFSFPVIKQKVKKKKRSKDLDAGYSSPEEFDPKMRFSLKTPPREWDNKPVETDESPEDAEVREITEGKGVSSQEECEDECDTKPDKIFPEPLETTKRESYTLRLPKVPVGTFKRRSRNAKPDRNPLRKMFGRKSKHPEDGSEEDGTGDLTGGRYNDAALTHVQSDTESADHGSADKSSMSKLTSEKQPKKLMSGLFGSFRKGKNKDKVADDPGKNPSSFEISVKEQAEDVGATEIPRPEGIVYAELDMARSPVSVMRRDDEKTEYAEIIYPGSKIQMETPELRKSRENLSASRSNLTEVDEAYSTTPDGKKEAAV